ncbi:hypothetical protein D3C80_770730 [compost metagenome]
MRQQRVGSNQQDLEEYEQVEQVAGEEGTVDAHQLELEQRVEAGAALIVATHGVEQREQRQQRSHQQQQRAQAVEHEDDAEGCHPVAQGIDLQRPGRRLRHQHAGQRQQCEGGEQRQGPLPVDGEQAAAEQQQAAAEHRQQDRQDQRVIHGLRSWPSTWSVLVSPTLRSARTTTKAVMAKPMTMAVSTSACGSGSV